MLFHSSNGPYANYISFFPNSCTCLPAERYDQGSVLGPRESNWFICSVNNRNIPHFPYEDPLKEANLLCLSPCRLVYRTSLLHRPNDPATSMPPKERHNFPTSSWRWCLLSSSDKVIPDDLESKLTKWQPCSTFPSVIHQELLHLKVIPDPNVGENERPIQWVGERDWEYSCSFDTPDSVSAANHVELVFEGLDTFAIVTLNGQQILQSDNMFIPRRVDVKQLLQAPNTKQENQLVILFESPVKKGKQLEEEHGARFSMMRDKKRMHMRKAQVC